MSLQDKKIVIIGAGSGIAARLAADATVAGAEVVLAGRAPSAAVQLDLRDEESIRRLGEQVGPFDHLVSLAAAHANGPVAELDAGAVAGAFDAKVIGPILLAKHLAPRIRPGGAILLFSGVAAWKPAPGLAVMATTNGAVGFLAEALAVELAPIRVNALSPGIVDSGAWDRLGADKDGFFADTAAANPARRIGTPADISAAALTLLDNPFITGTTLHVDGGARLT